MAARSKGGREGTAPAAAGEYCNVLARQCGLDPAGHADSFADLLLLETPLPWRSNLYAEAGALPQAMIDLYALWLRRWQAGEPYNHRALQIAPDPELSQAGYRRVIFYTRPPGAFAQFTRVEYMVPNAEAGALLWALYEERDRLPAFEPYRLPEPPDRPVRDILVCTHGTVDVACARFGYPLYRHLRDRYQGDDLRIWRASHFGGHVFAPTLIDLPTGHYWAYVTEAAAAQIVGRCGDVPEVRGCLRGWAGLADGFAQAADCALSELEGWGWFDCARQAQVIAQDESAPEPQWATLRIDYTRPDGTRGVYSAEVRITHTVATRHSSGDADEYAYPQYAVSVV